MAHSLALALSADLDPETDGSMSGRFWELKEVDRKKIEF